MKSLDYTPPPSPPLTPLLIEPFCHSHRRLPHLVRCSEQCTTTRPNMTFFERFLFCIDEMKWCVLSGSLFLRLKGSFRSLELYKSNE
jgi:hypothetical protein